MRAVRRHWNELGHISGGDLLANIFKKSIFPLEDLNRFRSCLFCQRFSRCDLCLSESKFKN